MPRDQVDEELIAITSATGQTMRRIVGIAKVAGVPFRIYGGVMRYASIETA